jgi:hypothetical protein
MATRTVRLDDETEKVLSQVREATGLGTSEALKRGLRVLWERVQEERPVRAYDVYKKLDLGPGGYAIAPSSEVKRGVREALRKKYHR